MKVHEPIGNPLIGPLLVRVALGCYLIMTGLAKLENHGAFIDLMKKTKVVLWHSKLMPEHFATVYGILLPYLEVASGVLLVLGMWTTLAALFASVIAASYVVIGGVVSSQKPLVISKDILILGSAISLMYSGSGVWSVDRLGKGGGAG